MDAVQVLVVHIQFKIIQVLLYFSRTGEVLEGNVDLKVSTTSYFGHIL